MINWEAVEAISSTVSALGVIISIVFLIVELRHNARAIEGATEQSLMTLEKDVFALLADNAALYRSGCKGLESLDDNEKFQFERIVAAVMSLVYSAHVQYRRNLIPKKSGRLISKQFEIILKAPDL